jgi:hypothetical protein
VSLFGLKIFSMWQLKNFFWLFAILLLFKNHRCKIFRVGAGGGAEGAGFVSCSESGLTKIMMVIAVPAPQK